MKPDKAISILPYRCLASGGVSDPRNGTMMKMFNLIDIGERAGSGVPSIFSVWKQQGWSEPTITVSSEPNRSTLVLPLTKGAKTFAGIYVGEATSTLLHQFPVERAGFEQLLGRSGSHDAAVV